MTKYRHLEFSAAQAAPTPKEMATIEAVLGTPVPSYFKDFLRSANGARIYYSLYIETDEVVDTLDFFQIFSTSTDGGADTFLGEIASLRARLEMPQAILPFASAYGASVALLDLRPNSHGRILAHLDGYHGGTGFMREPPFVRIAESFDAYLSRLVPENSDEAFGIRP